MALAIALLFCSAFLPVPRSALAHSIEGGLELGLGAGYDTESLGTHPSFVMLRSSNESVMNPSLLWGLEGVFMVIDSHETTYVASAVPFIRYLGAERTSWKPFGEFGLGIGMSNHDEVNGRQLGGKFMFSTTITLGAEVRTEDFGMLIVSTRFMHYSNGGLYPFNQSYNAQFIVLSILI